MDNNLKNALNKEQVIPELRISEPEKKNSFLIFPRFRDNKICGFEFKLTIWIDSIKKFFNKKKMY